VIGTLDILRALIRFNARSSHPLYKAEERHLSAIPLAQYMGEVIGRVWKPVLALTMFVVAIAAADFLCGGTQRAVSSVIFQICSIGGGSFILFCLLLLTYLWPLGVAVAASSVIVQERERQTWDVLLTTPLDWQDIILIKLSATLSRFNTYVELFLWMQGFLMIIIVVLVLAAYSRENSVLSFSLFQIPLVILTVAEFGIGRTQDYIIASIIGLISSLLASTRQAAGLVAVMAAVGMVLLRALVTTIIIMTMRPTSLPGTLILLSTGPASVVAIALPGLVAAVVLIIMVVLREIFIRYSFNWLITRLGDETLFDRNIA
jgi:hypothetical protein